MKQIYCGHKSTFGICNGHVKWTMNKPDILIIVSNRTGSEEAFAYSESIAMNLIKISTRLSWI